MRLATININGLSTQQKQIKFHSFLSYHKIDIVLVQEHNVKDKSTLDYLLNFYTVILNPTINIKGGTAIMYNKKLELEIVNMYLHPSSRITEVSIKYQKHAFDVICIYSHSGSNHNKDREEFFDQELLPLLQNSSMNLILGGDWNCILSDKDSSNPNNCNISKSLKSIVSIFKFKDVHNLVQKIPEYTYVKQNYASRLDRIYISDGKFNNLNMKTVPLSFTDHSAVLLDFKLENLIEFGKSYWKLNCSLLKEIAIKEDFKVLWLQIVEQKKNYASILEWWEFLAKVRVKEFYIKVGAFKKRMRYGMLNMLENRLRSLYEAAYSTGAPDFEEINSIKARIEHIKDELSEGILVRARMKDLQCGEKISKHIINKQREMSARKLMSSIVDDKGNELKTYESIQRYVKAFYTNLYSFSEGSSALQNKFLSHITCKIDEDDREMLNQSFSKAEIAKCIKTFNKNKTPGIDGLPIEFYCENWEIIGNDFMEVVNYITRHKIMSKSQHKGVITLLKKDGNGSDIKNWRPISLLCVDYKIVSKLIAKRVQLVLPKLIDENQYCSIPGRSIIHCNMLIRDIVYYVNKEDIGAAFLKLDWYKAFDLVNLKFLFNILGKMGFGEDFIMMVKMLYEDIESAMSINNCIGEFFPIKRSVRQGCPLSMILYVLYQEPFYAALNANSKVNPLILPDHMGVKAVGYADDTNIIITSEESLLETVKLVKEFEGATGSLVNRNLKSKIFAMGKWEKKRIWPISWLAQDEDSHFALGIHHCNSYSKTLKANWDFIVSKIESQVRVVNGRKLTLFQRASFSNSCILSRLWYTSHVYPLDICYGRQINKVVFKYLWGGRYEPVKRSTVCLEKDEGGLGIFDCLAKANALFVNTFLKMYVREEGCQSFLKYYCNFRLYKVLPRDDFCPIINSIPSPYYGILIDKITRLNMHPKFPQFANRELYNIYVNKKEVTVEIKYPLFDWRCIWKNFHMSDINLFEKDLVYKHLHDVLTVRKRLFMLNLSENDNCNICNVEESAIHLFYFCKRIAPVFKEFLTMVKQICNFVPINNIRFIYFDFKIKETPRRNACVLLLYSYLSVVWAFRNQHQASSEVIKEAFHRRCQKNKRDVLLKVNKVREIKLFGDYLKKILDDG